MFKRILIILSFLAAAPHLAGQGLAFADTRTQDGQPCPPECVSDSMEIVTWYPSPYNEYEELRLYPKVSADESRCDSFDKLGLMYYNKDQQALKVCWQDPANLSYSWKDITLGGGFWQLSGSGDIYNANSGRVGIGVNNPSQKLDVAGVINARNGIVIGNAGSGVAGMIRFSGTNFEGYDGIKWISLSGGSGGGSALTDEQKCTQAGGQWETTRSLCWFNSNKCPLAFNSTGYTSTSSCSAGNFSSGCGVHCGCTSGQHSRSAAGVESCCGDGKPSYGNYPTECCSATITEVGCTPK